MIISMLTALWPDFAIVGAADRPRMFEKLRCLNNSAGDVPSAEASLTCRTPLSKTTFGPKPRGVAMAIKICNWCIAVAIIERPNGTIRAGARFVFGAWGKGRRGAV